MRLAQFLSRAGHCSRRAASRLIDAGQIRVDGNLAGHLTFVDGSETIRVAGAQVVMPSQYRYVIYNKPVGIDCNCVSDDPDSIINQLSFSPRLFPVGRLDKDSHGLLLLTNDGELCHRLLSPQFNHPKTYRVSVMPYYGGGDINEQFRQQMSGPVALKQDITRPCKVEIVAINRFEITLTQGLNRQIRKMAQACGYRVTDLQRTSIVDIELAELGLNRWRDLTASEVASLKLKSNM